MTAQPSDQVESEWLFPKWKHPHSPHTLKAESAQDCNVQIEPTPLAAVGSNAGLGAAYQKGNQ